MQADKFITVLLEEIALQRERLFLWAPVFLACGIGFYFWLPVEPPLWPAGLCVAVLTALLIWLRERRDISAVILILLLVAGGFLAAQIRTMSVYTPILQKKLGPITVTGTIEKVEELEEGKGRRLLLRDLAIEKLPPDKTPVLARLTIRKEEGFAPGQRVSLLAQLNPPSPPVAPGAFDFQRYMYFQQIGVVGFIYKKLEVLQENATDGTGFIEDLRNVIAARFAATLGPGQAPMAIAFTTGQRSAISEDDNTAMQNSGLAHLISISGVHIGLFSAFVFFVTRFVMACIPGWALKRPIKKYAAVLAFVAAAFYTLLAGASIPTVRSLIMVGIAYLAIMLDRSPFSIRLVAFAAFIVLLMAPESLISASFQMSFAAVAALILFFEWLRPWWSEWNRRAGFFKKSGLYLAGTCLTTIVATVATAPFSLFHFQQLALYGLLSNALAMPLTSFVIMPGIIFALALMPLHLEWIPLVALDRGIAALLQIAHDIAALPHAVLHVSVWPLGALVLTSFGLVVLGLWQGRLRLLGLAPILLSLFLVTHHRPPDILLSTEFGVAAYRSDDGALHVSGRRSDRFAIENWERMLGLPAGKVAVWPKEGTQGDISCDSKACRLVLRGHKISFLKKPAALHEECAWADVVLSFAVLDNRECDQTIVRDKLDGFRYGAHALWLEPSGIVMKTAEEERGHRPWSD